MIIYVNAKRTRSIGMIYLDNSATTKPYPEVIDTFVTVSTDYFGNPSSIHGLGGQAERLLTQSRELCAKLLGILPQEIIFTSGGTEGNNLAIKGSAFQHQARGKHIITTSIEHPSTSKAFEQLEDLGFNVTYLPVDHNGLISIKDLEAALSEETILVSVIHVNNELGSVQPIEEIGQCLEKYPKALFHVDHVQGIGKVPIEIKKANVDLCTISGHKFHSVKGTGLLYVREGLRLSPLLSGGVQERSLRAGTENPAGIAAMTKALRIMLSESHTEINKLAEMKQYLTEELNKIKGVAVNTPTVHAAPHIVNFSVDKVKPEVLIHSLEEKEIYVSTKSACSSKSSDISQILSAIGLSEDRAKTAIRISMSFENTMEELNVFIRELKEILPKLQKVMG